MYDLLDSPATVNQSGISNAIDGLFGAGTTSGIGDFLGQAAQGWLSQQFPERNAEQSLATASPQDTAINEIKAQTPDMTQTYIKYGVYGGLALLTLGLVVYVARG